MNLFKSFFHTSPQVPTDTMGVVNSGYPKIVQDIHREFLTAGDSLLAKANEILTSLVIPNEEKAKRLSNLGFEAVKDVVEANQVKNQREQQERIAQAISDFHKEYPNNKFITDEIVQRICKKYGLVMGTTNQYKGFVPEKNLTDIERFYSNHPEDKNQYVCDYYGNWGVQRTIVTKKIYEYNKNTKEDSQRYGANYNNNNIYHIDRTVLNICAPIRDMNTDGHKLKDHLLVKDVPDPIVLLPKTHSNGVEGAIIITAWGDEASDPEIVNQNNN